MTGDRVDVVVIGAGVVGLAVARALALRGREVLVLEAERAVGTGITARNSEVIHAGFYYPADSLKARLCVAGREQLYRFCVDHGVDCRRLEKLVVANGASQQAVLERLLAQGLRNGVGDLRLVDGRDARALEPALRCDAALHSPSTGIVDAHGLTRALRADAEEHGANVALSCRVEAVHVGDGFELEIGRDRERLACTAIVNAAGLDAQRVARSMVGFPAELVPPLYLVKGNYFQLAGRAPFSRLIYPVPEPGGLGIHLTLDLSGRARFGPDVELVDRVDYQVDARRAPAFAASIRSFWPELPEAALEPGFAGLRPRITPAGVPLADFAVLGPERHGIGGLVQMFGIESPGLTCALALGDHVADLLGG